MTKVILLVILIALVLLLFGCGGASYHWEKRVGPWTAEELERDQFVCESLTRQYERSFGRGYDRESNAFSYYARCMSVAGWTFVMDGRRS